MKTATRYIVTQLLNTWVVRDTELLKRRKRSIVSEHLTKEEADKQAFDLNEGEAASANM